MSDRTCRYCEEVFRPMPGKPGRVDVCCKAECQRQDERDAPEPDLTGGNMVWHHKTAPEIEIKPMGDAKRFARKTRRFGASITMSLAPPPTAGWGNKE